jgi:diacylglycerol kinase (ATP)
MVRNEAAFRQELWVFLLALPCGWIIAANWDGYLLLLGSLLLVMLVEVLNTSIEATCDAVSESFSEKIQIAKDCGSLAVAISIIIAGLVWLLALAHWISDPQLLTSTN